MSGHSEWWLNPPDSPTHADCSCCGGKFDCDDLTTVDKLKDIYVCEDCWEQYEVECICCECRVKIADIEVIANSLGNPERFCPECAKQEREYQAYKIARIEGISSADFGPEMDDDRPVIAVDQTIELGSLPF